MNSKIENAIKVTKKAVSKNSSAILTTFGIVGFFGTAALTAKATTKAVKKIERAELKKEKSNDLSKKEIVTLVWKDYVPAFALGISSTICIISAQKINAKRTSSLAAAYKIASLSLDEYKEKVIETIGEKKAKEIDKKVSEKRLKSSNNSPIIVGEGKVLCYDPCIDRYFESDMITIDAAVNKFNKRLLNEDFLSLNEFYDELGVKHTKLGDDLGWNIGNDGLIEVTYDTCLSPDNKPCLVMNYRIEPRYDFSKLY